MYTIFASSSKPLSSIVQTWWSCMETGEHLIDPSHNLCCVCDTDITSQVKQYSQCGRAGKAFTSNLRSGMILTRSAWPVSWQVIVYTIIGSLCKPLSWIVQTWWSCMETGERLTDPSDNLCCVCDTDIASQVKQNSQCGRDGKALFRFSDQQWSSHNQHVQFNDR